MQTDSRATVLRFVPAAALSLDAFADVFTRSFEGYFYAMTVTAPMLAARARLEQIDLSRSLVMLRDGETAGQALLALRGDRAWCGGFGIAPAFRGQGLARQLIAALIEQAREAGAARFGLEVLTRNPQAIKTYLGAGLEIVRDLHVFQWQADPEQIPTSQTTGVESSCIPADPRALLRHFDRLHPVPAAWQRDLASLLVKPGLRGLALGAGDAIHAYVLYTTNDTAARIEDLGATEPDQVVTLLRDLQRRLGKITSVNQPADSPLSAAFPACGFHEADRQHDMALALA